MILLEELKSVLNNYEGEFSHKNESKLLSLKEKSIVLYGAGNIGKKLFKILKENNFNVLCFLDKNKNIDKSIYEVPVYHPEDFIGDKREVHIITSALFTKMVWSEVREYLKSLNFEYIYPLQEIDLSSLSNGKFYDALYDHEQKKIDLANLDKEKILKAFSYFEDDKDKELYINYIKAHLSMNFTGFKEPYDVSMQYLAHDIDIVTNYRNYVDCGGFNGDTLRNLISAGKDIEKFAIFEPQNDLCNEIYQYVNSNGSKFKEANIFPCGVGEKFEKVKFNILDDSKSSCRVSEVGEEVIQCVPIDAVLWGFKPTFIKMDIEGSEKRALRGARNTIMENHPQLAICVYHSLADIWEVPLLIKEFYEGYKFHLRSYNYMGLETVLYAFPDVEE